MAAGPTGVPSGVPTIGLLYPGHAAEDDFAAFAAAHADLVRLPLVHTAIDSDAHTVESLTDMGNADRLAEGADRLVAEHDPDVVLWACTSGSFVYGLAGARRQVDEVATRTGRPASSTSLGFVAACRRLGVDRVALAASYPDLVAARFRTFLGDAGITVAGRTSHDIPTASEVGDWDADRVLALVDSVPLDGAEALLVPDTAMHTLARLNDLEAAAGVPVLTANQVTVFEGLRLVGGTTTVPDAGRLLAPPGPDGPTGASVAEVG